MGDMEPRSDTTLARTVDDGVLLLLAEGRQAAEPYLRHQHVPQHVSLRVLACAAFRRKPVLGISLEKARHGPVV